MRPRVRQNVICGLEEYVALARHDPGISLSLTKIAERIDVHRQTILNYRGDPRVAALLGELEGVKEERRRAKEILETETAADGAAVAPSAAVSAPPSVEELRTSMTADPIRALTDAALAMRMERVVQESQWAMQKYLGHRRRDADVSDAPRVAFDLDEALRSLHAVAATLKPLVAEQSRRERERRRDTSGEDDEAA